MLTWPDPSLPASVRAGLTGPGAPFEIVEEYVHGVRHEVFRERPHTLVETLVTGAERLTLAPTSSSPIAPSPSDPSLLPLPRSLTRSEVHTASGEGTGSR